MSRGALGVIGRLFGSAAAFFSRTREFGPVDLVAALAALGIAPGDVVMVHSGFEPRHGFRGTPMEFIDALIRAVGPQGTLVMMSMPFRGKSAHAWLSAGKPFDVRRSVSMVGIVSEVFRRRKDVVRSVHPTHPVAVWGAEVQRFTAPCGDPAPFGPRSPFGRLLELDGKVLLYGVPFQRMTFEHFIEDHMQALLPVPLYRPAERAAVIGHDRVEREMEVLTLTDEVNRCRRSRRLERALRKARALRVGRVGGASLMLGDARAMIAAVDGLVERGWRFHRRPR